MAYQLTHPAQIDRLNAIAGRASYSAASGRALAGEFVRIFEMVAADPGMGFWNHRIPAGLKVKLADKRRWAVIYTEVPKGQIVTIVRIVPATSDLAALFSDETGES